MAHLVLLGLEIEQVVGGGGHLDGHALLDLHAEVGQLVDLIGEYARNGFREKPEFAGRRDELLPYRDNDNSRRIYEYIANAQIPDKLKRRLKEKKF